MSNRLNSRTSSVVRVMGQALSAGVKSVVLDNTNKSLSAPQAPCERAHKEGGGIARCSAASSMVNY